MLVDTGASHTSIALHTARDLGLVQIGTASLGGAHGRQPSPKFFARCIVRFPNGYLMSEAETVGIPDMEHMMPPLNDGDADRRLIGLLGREFLHVCRMSYDGLTGTVHVAVPSNFLRPFPLPPD